MKRLDLIIPLRGDLDEILEEARRYAPTLPALLRLGRRREAASSVAACLCRHFGVARQDDWPLAPISAQADGLDAGTGHWLRLDPVHLEIGMGGLMLHPGDELGIDADEAAAMVETMRPCWAAAGIELLAPHATRWYLRLPEPPRLSATPVDRLAGAYLTPHLPEGAGAQRLMRLVNEAQMLLHDHPVNLAREARGQASVNGLWPWGGGSLPRLNVVHDLIADHRQISLAMAAFAGIEAIPCPATLAAAGAGRPVARMLAVLPEPAPEQRPSEQLAALERDWLRPMLRALRLGRLRRASIAVLTQPALHVELDTLGSWGYKVPAVFTRARRADG